MHGCVNKQGNTEHSRIYQVTISIYHISCNVALIIQYEFSYYVFLGISPHDGESDWECLSSPVFCVPRRLSVQALVQPIDRDSLYSRQIHL